MWKPLLSAANQVRCTFMPPKKRTLMSPSSLRLHGQPQCSSCTISSVQCSTKYCTASWSHSQSPPETVSSKWLSSESSPRITPAEPPSAATVWLRIGTTLDTSASSARVRPRRRRWPHAGRRRRRPPPPHRSGSLPWVDCPCSGLALTAGTAAVLDAGQRRQGLVSPTQGNPSFAATIQPTGAPNDCPYPARPRRTARPPTPSAAPG